MRNAALIASMLLGVLVACGPLADPGADHDRRNVIALGGRTIDTRAPEALPAQPGDETALVKFAGPVSREQLAQLSQAARIYTYLPHDTFLVRPYRTASALAARYGRTRNVSCGR